MQIFMYKEYRKLKAWKIIEKVLEELEENQDIKITTMRDLVIGYIIKNLEKHDLLKKDNQD